MSREGKGFGPNSPESDCRSQLKAEEGSSAFYVYYGEVYFFFQSMFAFLVTVSHSYYGVEDDFKLLTLLLL